MLPEVVGCDVVREASDEDLSGTFWLMNARLNEEVRQGIERRNGLL